MVTEPKLPAWLEALSRYTGFHRRQKHAKGRWMLYADLRAAWQAQERGLDLWISVNQALHAVGSKWRIEQHASGQAVAVPVPDVFSGMSGNPQRRIIRRADPVQAITPHTRRWDDDADRAPLHAAEPAHQQGEGRRRQRGHGWAASQFRSVCNDAFSFA